MARSITILEKYQMLGTLFLIGSLSSPDAYRSNYLEIHSHTWDMHTLGQCPSSVGRGGILCLDEDKILEDLKKSRESLNNTLLWLLLGERLKLELDKISLKFLGM